MAEHRNAGARLGADVLLDSLYQSGARICFANPGTTELGLVSALARDGRLRCVLSLFEGVCTDMPPQRKK